MVVEVTDTPGLRKGDLRRLSVPEMLAVKDWKIDYANSRY